MTSTYTGEALDRPVSPETLTQVVLWPSSVRVLADMRDVRARRQAMSGFLFLGDPDSLAFLAGLFFGSAAEGLFGEVDGELVCG